jgi:hypothetical protein
MGANLFDAGGLWIEIKKNFCLLININWLRMGVRTLISLIRLIEGPSVFIRPFQNMMGNSAVGYLGEG